MIVSGAMGVDKVKKTDTGPIVLHRFILILCFINTYFRKLRGECRSLPYLGQLGLVLSGPDEQLLVDSEDMESCFNIYTTNPEWPKYFTFNRKVSQGALGGDPNKIIWVGLTIIPVGCKWAVDF